MKIISTILSLIIYWRFTNCSSNFGYYVNESKSKISLKTSTISQVPKDCPHFKQVKIDELLRETSNGSDCYYAIYGNHSYYVKIDGITKDHFPIVRLENQPKKYDQKANQLLKDAKKVNDYIFDENGYSYKNKTTIEFIGFNSVWLGCPQQLCLSSNIDAATRLQNGSIYVFRGNYYWDLKDPPLVTNAIRISRWKGNNTRKSGFDSGYFNSVVTNLNFTSFFKGNIQYIWDNGSISETAIPLTPSEFEYKMDAGFSVINGSEGLMYSIRGEKYVVHSYPFETYNTKDMGIPWNEIDAAFGENNTIYIFKDWYYIKLAQDIPVPAVPTLSFHNIFKCPEYSYNMFGGYEAFIEKYLNLKTIRKTKSDFRQKSEDTKSVNIEDKSFSHESVVITIIILFIIIAIVIFIVLRRKNQQRFVSLRKTRKAQKYTFIS